MLSLIKVVLHNIFHLACRLSPSRVNEEFRNAAMYY